MFVYLSTLYIVLRCKLLHVLLPLHLIIHLYLQMVFSMSARRQCKIKAPCPHAPLSCCQSPLLLLSRLWILLVGQINGIQYFIKLYQVKLKTNPSFPRLSDRPSGLKIDLERLLRELSTYRLLARSCNLLLLC